MLDVFIDFRALYICYYSLHWASYKYTWQCCSNATACFDFVRHCFCENIRICILKSQNITIILLAKLLRKYKMSIGVPIKVLHEAEGHIITCETNTGEVYRGKLVEAEDNMNCQMTNITVTFRQE